MNKQKHKISLSVPNKSKQRAGLFQRKAFTLVELIVVITILAILGTIAFISLQGYSATSRDSVRISDVSNMKTSLDLFHLNAGKYPLPDDYGTFTYLGNDLFYQGYFGDNVVQNVSRNMTEIPTDPLTDRKYIYSVSNNKNELEILSLLESYDVAFNAVLQTNAAGISVIPKISGNYNGLFIKTKDHIVPTPSIITSEEVLENIDYDLTQSRLESMVTNLGENVPEGQGNVLGNTGALTGLVLTGAINNLTKDSTDADKAAVIEIIKSAYVGETALNNEGIIDYILNLEENDAILATVFDTTVLNSATTSTVVAVVPPINGICGTDNGGDFLSTPTNLCISGTANPVTDNGVGSTFDWTCDSLDGGTNISCSANHIYGDWRDEDDNCILPDVTIGTQTWAGCNSTLGNGFEFGQTDADIGTNNYNGIVGSCFDYNGNDTATCTKGDVTMASNTKANTWFSGTNSNSDKEVDNIWGKYYTWENSSSACTAGYHVPTDLEWEYAEEYLIVADGGEANCRNTTKGRLCDGTGWKLHSSTNATNNLVLKLGLPLSGYRTTNGITFFNRGSSTLLWSEYVITTTSHGRRLDWGTSAVHSDSRGELHGFSVRCIKD